MIKGEETKIVVSCSLLLLLTIPSRFVLTCEQGFTFRIRNMLGLINYESLQVDVDTKVDDPLVNLHEDTSSTARTQSKDHVLENDQTVVEPIPTNQM